MKFADRKSDKVAVGLAYGPGVPAFAARSGLVDYIEMPFEQLRRSPELVDVQDVAPVVLHCASMSIAGFVPPDDATIDAIARQAVRTATPWIGEHLAFVSADGVGKVAGGSGEPTSLTYTLCPQLSEETVQRVADNLAKLRPRVPVPLILENSPQYFPVPGSSMNMVEFICEVTSRCDVNLLLDLSHFVITCLNTGVDAARAINQLPLERVVEVHMSGMSTQSGIVWDDHASPAPDVLFDLLEAVIQRTKLRAVTFEYNWSPSFPASLLESHMERARRLTEAA